jgi:uncharacterized protein (DUF1778 family)
MSTASALSLRISHRDRKLIDRAAQAQNKSRTEFMLDSARAAATDALLDQRLFVLDETEMQAFEKALTNAPKVETLIENLKTRPSPWAK